MSRVSYFQTFSQRENHVTNNTLLLLRYVYQSSQFKLESLLSELFESAPSLGLHFDQQIRESYSVPDAVMSQDRFRIYIETKLGAGLWRDQIERHARGIGQEKHEATYLIGLTRSPIADAEQDALKQACKDHHVIFASVTFSDVLAAARSVCAEHEVNLASIIDDYETFLASVGLLDDRWKRLAAVACGTSYQENETFRLYYEGADRRSKDSCRFLGIYRNKTVSLIGAPRAVLICRYENDGVVVEKAESGTASADDLDRIKKVIESTGYYDLKNGSLRFYLVDEWAPCEIRKASPGGIRAVRYIDLTDYVPEAILRNGSLTAVAEKLSGIVFK